MCGASIFEIHADSYAQFQAAIAYSSSVHRLLRCAEDS